MRLLIDIAVAVAIAVVLGFATAWYAVDRGFLFGGISVGPWEAWPRAGSPDADPYSIARLARTGEVPLGAQQRAIAQSLFAPARDEKYVRGDQLLADLAALISVSAGPYPP